MLQLMLGLQVNEFQQQQWRLLLTLAQRTLHNAEKSGHEVLLCTRAGVRGVEKSSKAMITGMHRMLGMQGLQAGSERGFLTRERTDLRSAP